MTQETIVLELDPAAQDRLAARLEGEPFEFRSVPHARFSARGRGVVATLYRSGKLVVQGAAAGAFAARYLDPDVAPAAGASAGGPILDAEALRGPVVGCDEAGKGDYFGPLVAVALRAEPDARAELQRAGVADSKTLSDERALRLGAALRERYPCAIEVLEPEAYNRAHAECRNVNTILARLHGRAIRALAQPGDVVLVDRFAREELVADELAGLPVRLIQVPRAESEPVVAAASIVARAVFLEELRALSEAFAVDLHKGAGAPTDAAGRRFLALHDRSELGRVAKLHFKNTGKIGG